MATGGSLAQEEAADAEVDAVVIGAGFAGLYMLHRLREMGFRVLGFEKGSGVGGTWFWNRYPGARCDSESMYYSYSFLPDLEQEWPLEERYPAQPDILRYLEHVAERLDLARHFRFETAVTGLTWDDAGRWTVWVSGPDGNRTVTARWVVTGVGCLSAANLPALPGAESFAGESYHTGRWPTKPVDFTGKRVAVIGTGASGIQSIPVIASQAAHVTVFQRTPQFTIPAANGPLDPEMVRLWKANYREWRRRSRVSRAGFPYSGIDRSALEVDDDERRRIFDAGWTEGGFSFTYVTFNDLLLDERSNAYAVAYLHRRIDELVEDPEVADRLKPTGYPFGAKRLPLDTGYYETFNLPHVDLVDLRQRPIQRVTASSIETTDGTVDVDIIVYATGFDAMTGPLLALDIRGRDGIRLRDAWADGPVTYLGLAVPGFPNLFTITGPGSPSVLANMPTAIEQHVEWIAACIGELGRNGDRVIEASAEAAEAWTAHVQAVASHTLFPRADSWYVGANIEGKPRVFMPYVAGLATYAAKCDQVAGAGYEGFVRQGAPAGTEA